MQFVTVVYSGREVRLAPSSVPAGFPSPAGDDIEDVIDPVAWIVRHEAATFWWRVSGDSLTGMGILDGDLVAIDRAAKKRIGRVVLALHDGQVTLKVLGRREDGRFVLEARSLKEYPPIVCGEATEIWGVLAGVARKTEID